MIERAFARGAERFGLRLTQYAILSNHLHLLVEAEDGRAIARGMQGLLVRLARALNKLWRRVGSFFWDRYHARALVTPREVRNVLVYVLNNARHHGLRIVGVDEFTSGPWFDGWSQRVASTTRALPGALARSWLLRVGWRRYGSIGACEAPRRAPP